MKTITVADVVIDFSAAPEEVTITRNGVTVGMVHSLMVYFCAGENVQKVLVYIISKSDIEIMRVLQANGFKVRVLGRYAKVDGKLAATKRIHGYAKNNQPKADGGNSGKETGQTG